MEIFYKVHEFITEHQLIPPESTIILGLSGGPDSVFLFHYFIWAQQKTPFSFIAAHLDHQWRTDSAADAAFCEQLAASHKIPFVLKKADEITLNQKPQSREEEGRILRRTFFEEIRKQHNADRIALAHHRNDQHETFFIRLFRGAGATGLGGMRPQHGPYIHPLLTIAKESILAYLNENTLPYKEDPTNKHPEFLRNCIRHKGLPALEACDSRLPISLDRTMKQLREVDSFIETYVDQHFSAITEKINGIRHMSLNSLFDYHPYIQKRLILHLLISADVPFTPSQLFLEEIIRFLYQKKSVAHHVHPQWRIVKKKGHIAIHRETH